MSKRTLHLFTTSEIAEELALRDAELLRRIDAAEIRNGAWMDKERKSLLAPNVLTMVHAFNSLAQLVTKEILAEEGLKRRAEVIAAYIKVAKMCYKLRNYNSLNAILAGLMCTPVHRLKKTWKEVPSKRKRQISSLTDLMSEEGNWREYRKELNRRVATGTTCVIFLGVLLTNVVRYESYHQLKKLSRQISRSAMPTVAAARKCSVVEETFTVLEAITVRNRLKRFSQMGVKDEEEEEKTIDQGSQMVKDPDDVSLELSILSEEDADSNGASSPDISSPNWSIEVCRSADRQLSPSRSPWKHNLRRGRSLEQLLRVCQEDKNCDSVISLSYDGLSRSLPRMSSAPSCSHDNDDKSAPPLLPRDQNSPLMLPQQPYNLRDNQHHQFKSSSSINNNKAMEFFCKKKRLLSNDSNYSSVITISEEVAGGSSWQGCGSREGSSSTVCSDQTDVDSIDSMATVLVKNDHPLSSSSSTSSVVMEREVVCNHENSGSSEEVKSGRIVEFSESSVAIGNHQSECSEQSVAVGNHQSNHLDSLSNKTKQNVHSDHSKPAPGDHHGNNSTSLHRHGNSSIRRLRKRYTASDELDVIHLQKTREEPHGDPASMLKLYQVLSLGYTLRYTSSPYIKEILDESMIAANCEGINYKRSYILQPSL